MLFVISAFFISFHGVSYRLLPPQPHPQPQELQPQPLQELHHPLQKSEEEDLPEPEYGVCSLEEILEFNSESMVNHSKLEVPSNHS